MASIVDLKKVVDGLSDKELFNRFFTFSVEKGRMEVPDKMKGWVEKTFGSVKAVESQKIVNVMNNFTYEGALYNELRAKRPMVKHDDDLDEEISRSEGGPFCNARTGTPKDVFGRAVGDHCVTASNVAKYDKWHGLVIFDEHNPLKFSQAKLVDYLEVARRWIDKASKHDKTARFPFIMWNCLWRSGASIVHGHMQVTLGTNNHYSGFQKLNRVRQDYMANYGTDYFDDLFQVHDQLGLALKDGKVRVMVHLTPRKEKEIIIIARELSNKFARTIAKAASCLRDDFGVESFNMGIALPPTEAIEGWEGFPIVARILDRGSLSQKTTDIGAVEMFTGASVISSDPFMIYRKLQKHF